MPTYIIVDKDKDPLGPNEINAGGTVQVNDGDTFIFDSTANENTQFAAANGTETDFSVEFNDSNSNDFDVKFQEFLNPSIAVADDVDLSKVKLDAGEASSATVNVGDNVTLEEYKGSKDGADILTIGDNFTTTEDIDTEKGDDSITVGSGATLKNIDTGEGEDSVVIGDDLTAGNIKTEEGDDIIRIGDRAEVKDVQSGEGDDSLTIGDDLSAGKIRTEEGQDTVEIGDRADFKEIDSGKDDDSITVGDDATGKKIKSGDGDDDIKVGADADLDEIDGGKGHDTLSTQSPGVKDKNIETDNVVCFARGTRITTDHGEVVIENLRQGDLVVTTDGSIRPIRWIGSMVVAGSGKLAPVEIRRGALDNARDLLVSPQHRMLLRGWQAQLYFGRDEVLVPAKHLINDSSIRQVECDQVEYFHILFDTHEIVLAEGAESESFHPGEIGINAMTEDTRDEIYEIFPQLRGDPAHYGPAARTSVNKHEARLLKPK
ncbi:Hint domain-containing protein [Roseovarius sp. S4756]|uniref:Hint domain-containing protein n=1 Tax=Roseovarius maritimus TaxID=3342637 RepID=UPI003729E4AC